MGVFVKPTPTAVRRHPNPLPEGEGTIPATSADTWLCTPRRHPDAPHARRLVGRLLAPRPLPDGSFRRSTPVARSPAFSIRHTRRICGRCWRSATRRRPSSQSFPMQRRCGFTWPLKISRAISLRIASWFVTVPIGLNNCELFRKRPGLATPTQFIRLNLPEVDQLAADHRNGVREVIAQITSEVRRNGEISGGGMAAANASAPPPLRRHQSGFQVVERRRQRPGGVNSAAAAVTGGTSGRRAGIARGSKHNSRSSTSRDGFGRFTHG